MLRQPIWVETLADALVRLAFDVRDHAGPLNVAGESVLSRDAFGRRMLAFWDVEGHERVETIRAASLPTPPPLDLRLDVSRARELLGMPLPGVESVLQSAGPNRP